MICSTHVEKLREELTFVTITWRDKYLIFVERLICSNKSLLMIDTDEPVSKRIVTPKFGTKMLMWEWVHSEAHYCSKYYPEILIHFQNLFGWMYLKFWWKENVMHLGKSSSPTLVHDKRYGIWVIQS